MNQGKRIVRNIFSNWSAHAISMLVFFFLTPFVVHKLGNTGYGIWILAISFTGQLGILDLGLRPIIVKYIAKYLALEDDNKINEVINTTIVAFSAIAGIIITASLIMSFYSDELFTVTPEYHSDMKAIIILAGLTVAVSFPFGVFNAVIHGFQRFDLSNICAVCMMFVRSALIVLFLNLGYGLVALGIITLAVRTAGFVLNYAVTRHIFPNLKINFRLASRKTMRMIYSFGFYTFLIGIAIRISFQIDSLVIGAMISAGAITFYTIGASLIESLNQLVTMISVTITPVVSAFEAQNRQGKLRELLLVGTRYALLIVLPIGLTYLFLGETFINLWMGVEYGSASSQVLIILMVAYFFYLSQLVAGSIFLGLGKVKTLSFLTFGTALVNLGLSLLLARTYGINGVALGTAIPLLIFSAVIHPIYICRVLQQNYFGYLRAAYLPPMIASLPFLAIIMALDQYVTIDSLPLFFVLVGGATSVFGVSAFYIALAPEHRQGLIEKGRVLLGRNRP